MNDEEKEVVELAVQGDFQATLATLEDANANPLLVFLDPAIKNPLWTVAMMLSDSQLVPEHFRGRPADCFLILQAAGRIRVDPLLMLQKTFMVKGKPGFESTFLISLVNTRGGFAHPLRFRYEGEGRTRSCTAWTTYKESEGTAEATVTMAMADGEGWSKNPKYKTMPDQMLAYRAGAFFSRLHCPDVTMGFHTVDELRDIDDTPSSGGNVAGLLRDRVTSILKEDGSKDTLGEAVDG